MTLQTISQEMKDNFELKKRSDGSEFYSTKETIEWQQKQLVQSEKQQVILSRSLLLDSK